MDSGTKIYKPKEGDDLALKPCPFCGSKEVVYEKYESMCGQRWRVVCCGCVATIDPGYAQYRWPVMNMWNRRAEDKQ